MLRFILGPAASGKTYQISQLIKRDVEQGGSPVLLVPEQFSFESEKLVLDLLSDSGAQAVSVMSFTRLCDELERVCGGISGRTLTDSDKLILMKRAVKAVRGELKYWQRYSSADGFVRSLVDTINEFKLNAVSPDDLILASEKSGNSVLSAKLFDVAMIYFRFNLLVAENFVDPSDRLEKLYLRLSDHSFFENKTVYIDSFKSFTGQQYRILERIFSQAENVYISLTVNLRADKKYGVFSNILKTKENLKALASAHSQRLGDDILLEESRYESGGLKYVEALMAGLSVKGEELSGAVTVCKAASVFDEAEFAARTIHRIVRCTDARYRDFVIIARDTAGYEEALSAACERNSIGCFIDKRIPLASLPPARAMLAAASLAGRLTTEGILNFHKSGIECLSSEELSALENYTYLWNIDGKAWYDEWTMNPTGFVSGELKPAAVKELDRINRLRMRAISPLEKFRRAFGKTPKAMAAALVELLEDCRAGKAFLRLEEKYRDEGKLTLADTLRRSWDELMTLLDSIVACFEDAEISTVEFCEALKSSVSAATVGAVPQGLDEVTFGAADRIRPSRPKYAFILGANQGVFPKTQTPSGIFRGRERQQLIDMDIKIPDRMLSSAIDEEFLVYSNVCCPMNGLFISYLDLETEGMTPSAFVSKLSQLSGCSNVCEPGRLSADNIPETYEAAFSEYCKRYHNSDEAAILKGEIGGKEAFSGRIAAVSAANERVNAGISEESALKLFGQRLEMSPSKLDSFNNCRFMFFCKYGIRAKKIQPADFDAMQRGTLIHYVLQKIIEKYGKEVSGLTDALISSEVEYFTDCYLDSVTGYRSVETPRSKFLVSTMVRSLKYIVKRLASEFAQSEFEPMSCELKIGADGTVPAIEIPADNGCDMTVSGIVDRLDSWNGYVRIVDYKTGARDFKLPDILFGQNLQMLIYLYAVSKSNIFGEKPAGIFYMPAKRIKEGSKAERRMSGITVNDEDLVCAMERLNEGEYVPRLSDKPNESFIEEGDFEKIFSFIERRLKITANDIYSGRMNINPIDGIGNNACKYCDFAAVCRIEDAAHECVTPMSNREVMEKIESEA